MEVDNKKLIIALGLVFILGVLFALVNGWYTNSTNEQLPLIVYGISFLSVIIGAFIVVLFQWKISGIQTERFLKVLPKEDRIIIKVLLDNKNYVEQNKLVVFSGFSKVKVSRILKKLEERDVIKKKSIGNTNMVVLNI